MDGIPVPKRLVGATHRTVQPGLFNLFSGPKPQTYTTKTWVSGAGLDTQRPSQIMQRQPLSPLLSEQLSLACIWWFLLSSYMKKSQALPTPQDARTHAGCKMKETGKVMMKQERRCWAQDCEGSSQALSDCLPGARGGRGCWASVLGFHGPHIAGLCVWAHTCVCVCVSLCGYC